MPSTCVILPLYNEMPSIARTLTQVLAYAREHPDIDFRFVDDGSTDGTAAYLQSALTTLENPQVQVISLQTNHGKGHAIQQGFSQSEADYLIFLDGDLAYSLDHLPVLIEQLVEHEIVIGSRELKPYVPRNSTWTRQILGRGFNHLTRILTGLPYPDTQAGLKAFRNSAARKIFSQKQIQGYGFDVELLFLAKKYRYRVKEIYAQVNTDHSYKTGKFKLLRDSLIMFFDLLRIRWNEFRGHYHAQHPTAGSP